MNNYYNFWSKRFVKDGFRYIKLVLGIGLSVSFFVSLNFPIAIMFGAWVLVDTLKDRE